MLHMDLIIIIIQTQRFWGKYRHFPHWFELFTNPNQEGIGASGAPLNRLVLIPSAFYFTQIFN